MMAWTTTAADPGAFATYTVTAGERRAWGVTPRLKRVSVRTRT